jgi:hypothetical protein
VQDQAVFDSEFFWMQNDLVGIAHSRISGDAPGLMAHDTGTVNASVGLAILVAVEDTLTIDQHG